MLELLNSNTLFATIAMLRPEKEGVFLLVEGNDDLFTIRQHVDDERVTLLSGLGGKSDLVAASNLVESNGIERVYFLIDKDYDEYITNRFRAILIC